MRFISYLRRRLNERSSWAQIGVGVTGAAALSAPWSYVFIGVAVVGVLIPDGGVSDGNAS